MIGLLQRVTTANVIVENKVLGEINQGLLVLLGVERDDNEKKATRLIERILTYRVFSDHDDKMNLSLRDVQGGLLLVPQFTLAADTKKGTRPGFSSAATPQLAETLFNFSVDYAKTQHDNVCQGSFGADMKVSLTNDGPVTFWLNT